MNLLISSFDAFENEKLIEILTSIEMHRVCFVATDFKDLERNNRQAKILKFQLDRNVEIEIVDERKKQKEMKAAIEKSDVIFLTGGDTYLQFQNLCRYELLECVKKHSGLVIGMSAGALNMTQHVILVKGMDRHVDETFGYEGVGRVDLCLFVHYNEFEEAYLNQLPKKIQYGIYSDGFLFLKDYAIICDKVKHIH